jgi:hypothetical protein
MSKRKKKIKKRPGEMTQGVGPEFKPQHHKKAKLEHFLPTRNTFH